MIAALRAMMRAMMLAVLAALLLCSAAAAQANRAPAVGVTTHPGQAADDQDDQDADQDDDEADAASPPVKPPTPQRAQDRAAPPRPGAARLQPPQMRAPPKVAVRRPSDTGVPTLDELTATRERPLFSTTRRPPAPEEKPDKTPEITEGGKMPFELVGVVMGDEVSAAIFRNTESKEESRVAKGDKIGNWNLEEVAARSVVLRGRDKRVRMRLFDEASGPGIRVGRVSGDTETNIESLPRAGDGESVDEDIAPTSSPQAKPATAQPKPPPSVRQEQQRRRLLRRQNRRNQQRTNNQSD